MQRSRPVYAGWLALVIATGLVSRSSRASFLPDFVATYGGDTLWALMVFLGLGFLFPGARTAVLAGAAVGIAFGVEFSQLCEADWLNRIRASRIGALVLGKGWVASDLLCYAVGVGIGVVGEVVGKKCRVILLRRGDGGQVSDQRAVDEDA